MLVTDGKCLKLYSKTTAKTNNIGLLLEREGFY